MKPGEQVFYFDLVPGEMYYLHSALSYIATGPFLLIKNQGTYGWFLIHGKIEKCSLFLHKVRKVEIDNDEEND